MAVQQLDDLGRAGNKNSEIKVCARNATIYYWLSRTAKPFLAVDNVDLDVYRGEFLVIVGPSGCGKTTLLNAIDGLQQLTSGELTLDGKPIKKPGTDRAMVFQQASLLPWRTVLKNVTYGLELKGGLSSAVAKKRARDLLKLVGLQGFEDHYPTELSGGMQQRVNLARALAVDPEVLLLDEPFAALDAQTRELMQAELLRIWSTTGKTAIFITHDIKEAIYLADRVVVFSARPGRIKECVDIDLPRPRNLQIKRDSRFLDYEDRIWTSIEEEVRATNDAMMAAAQAR
jgi:NitT/TauT family transport system ATP-binding protein